MLPLQSDITVSNYYRVKLPVVLNKIKKEKNQRKYSLKKRKKKRATILPAWRPLDYLHAQKNDSQRVSIYKDLNREWFRIA